MSTFSKGVLIVIKNYHPMLQILLPCLTFSLLNPLRQQDCSCLNLWMRGTFHLSCRVTLFWLSSFGSVPLPQIITVCSWGEKTHTDKQYEHSLKCTRQRMPSLHYKTFSRYSTAVTLDLDYTTLLVNKTFKGSCKMYVRYIQKV